MEYTATTQSLTDKQLEKLQQLENPKPRNRAERRLQAKKQRNRRNNLWKMK